MGANDWTNTIPLRYYVQQLYLPIFMTNLSLTNRMCPASDMYETTNSTCRLSLVFLNALWRGPDLTLMFDAARAQSDNDGRCIRDISAGHGIAS